MFVKCSAEFCSSDQPHKQETITINTRYKRRSARLTNVYKATVGRKQTKRGKKNCHICIRLLLVQRQYCLSYTTDYDMEATKEGCLF